MSYINTIYHKDDDLTYPKLLMKNLSSYFAYGNDILDVCPGNMKQSKALEHLSYHVEGIDIEPIDGLTYLVKDVCDPWPIKKEFSNVFSKSVLEHLDRPLDFIENCFKSLKFGGNLILMVPDWNSQKETFYDDPTHIHPYTVKGLNTLIEMHGGFNIKKCELFTQLPWSWGKVWARPFVYILSKFRWIKSKQTRFAHDKMVLLIASKNVNS